MRACTHGIAMERRGRTDIWPELNDVSNLTLLDKILRDARRGLPGHALTVTPPSAPPPSLAQA